MSLNQNLPSIPKQNTPVMDSDSPLLMSKPWWVALRSLFAAVQAGAKKETVSLTGQTASIAATDISVNGGVAPAGFYLLSIYALCTSAGSGAAALTVDMLFNDGSAARDYPWGCTLTTTSGITCVIAGQLFIKADGINPIQYSTTVVNTGSPVYALYLVLERIA